MPSQPVDLTTQRNITVGAGYCFFAPEDDLGVIGGEIYLGDGPGFTFSMESDTTEIDSSDTPTAETLVTLTNKITRSASVGVRNVSPQNMAFFVGGNLTTAAQTATGSDAFVAKQGRYFQLGVDDDHPAGIIGATSIGVTGGSETTDWVADESGARVYIVPGGAIVDETAITATYTFDVADLHQVVSGAGARKGSFRFVSDNTAGENNEWFFPLVELAPSGDVSLKDRSDPVEMTFDLNVLTLVGREQVYIKQLVAV